MNRVLLRACVLIALMSLSGVAAAQAPASEPTPAQVRAAAVAFDRGREAYKAENWVEAAEQFEIADTNAPSSAAIELAMRARLNAGELARAATLASVALKRHPDDANLLKIAPDIMSRAGRELFELTAVCDTPCDLTVDGKLVYGPPDIRRAIYVHPGTLTVRAGWSDNRSDSQQVDATVGGKGELIFNTPPLPEPAKAPASQNVPAASGSSDAPVRDEGPPPKRSGWSPVVFWMGVGATAVAGGITIWSGVDTQNDPGVERVREECRGQGEDCELYQDGLAKQLRTNVLLGVTGGLGAATILIGAVATDWSGGSSARSAARPGFEISPWATLSGGGLRASGRF
jgi:hypothetical protein